MPKKSILIVGSGGREHALGWKLSFSDEVEKIFFAPGNGGTSSIGENINILADDLDELLKFALEEKIDLTIVGPEIALASGIVDLFTKNYLTIFGPSKNAAKLESSKVFSAGFMEKHDIPRPKSFSTGNLTEAEDYINRHSPSDYVIKADGLAAGKGVILPTDTKEAKNTVAGMLSGSMFGGAGRKIVFQERLYGQEASAFAISDGKNIIMLPFFQDHKRVYDGDKGPNTGGVGCYTPVPIITESIAEQITAIMQRTVDGMMADGIPYSGVLYAGLFITSSGPKVIEYNVRFGDPECEAMMLVLESDLYPVLKKASEGKLIDIDLFIGSDAVADVVLCSGGYPGHYQTGLNITGLEEVNPKDALLFHAGTKRQGIDIVTSGGRVLNVVSRGQDLKEALNKAYASVEKIYFKGMHYRKDIGTRALS